MPLAALICLCGAPAPPALGDFTGRDMATGELERFRGDFKRLAGLVEQQTAATVGGFAAGRLAVAGAFDEQTVIKQLKKLEKNIGRVMAARDPGRGTLVGRHWKPPKRQPETQNGRARLAAALQKHGFAWQKAWDIVRAIFAAMAEALLRGEDVETPIGTFETFYGPRERTRVRWGKTQTLFRNYKRVRFRPSPALQACLAPPAQQKDVIHR